MITITLPGGETATIRDGTWSVPDSEELTRMLNSPAMQAPENGHYAPSPDARQAVHVLHTFGGKWVESDEHAPPGKLY